LVLNPVGARAGALSDMIWEFTAYERKNNTSASFHMLSWKIDVNLGFSGFRVLGST